MTTIEITMVLAFVGFFVALISTLIGIVSSKFEVCVLGMASKKQNLGFGTFLGAIGEGLFVSCFLTFFAAVFAGLAGGVLVGIGFFVGGWCGPLFAVYLLCKRKEREGDCR